MARAVKSLFWLATLTGAGFGLYYGFTPSEDKIAQLRKELPGSDRSSNEIKSKNQQFFDVIRSAAESNKPVYRMNKKDLEDLKKD